MLVVLSCHDLKMKEWCVIFRGPFDLLQKCLSTQRYDCDDHSLDMFDYLIIFLLLCFPSLYQLHEGVCKKTWLMTNNHTLNGWFHSIRNDSKPFYLVYDGYAIIEGKCLNRFPSPRIISSPGEKKKKRGKSC